jgi:membrane protease YdiL (CAAX protease family)
METPIGRQLTDSRPRAAASALVALLIVVADLGLVWRGEHSYLGPRAALAVGAPVIYLLLARGDPASVGLSLRPAVNRRYCLRATLAMGVAIGACFILAGGVYSLMGWEVPIIRMAPAQFWPQFQHACVLAPAVEEGIYRVGLCCGAVVLLGARGAIVVSGLVFGALHILYGNPGPDNLVAGFFLAWAFLKSGSILVPVALHALGNLCALGSWIGMWLWWTPH